MVIAGDPNATFIRDLVEGSGLAIRHGVRTGEKGVSCAGELLKWAESDRTTLSRLWPLMVAIHQKSGMIRDRLVRAMMYVEQRLEGSSLTDQRWRKVILSIPYDTLTESIRKSNELDAHAGPRSCAVGFLAAINRGRQRRLVVPGINAPDKE
jgi:hypothetical protein